MPANASIASRTRTAVTAGKASAIALSSAVSSSGVLPSGTITFPDGVVITAGGGGVLVLLATVAGGVEPLFAVEAGTPAEGFLATLVLGFLGFGGGACVVVEFPRPVVTRDSQNTPNGNGVHA